MTTRHARYPFDPVHEAVAALEWLRDSGAATPRGHARASLSVLEALLGEDVGADIALATAEFSAMLADMNQVITTLPAGDRYSAIRNDWQGRRQLHDDAYQGFSRSLARSRDDADRQRHLDALLRSVPPLDLRVRVARLRRALAGEGVGNGRINSQFRSPVKAHAMSVAWHILNDRISIASIRSRLTRDAVGQYLDSDGNLWFHDSWSMAATRQNAERLYRRYSGETQINYAIEGYPVGDLRRLPNDSSVPISSHVSGMAVDVSGVEWTSDRLNDGLGWRDAGSALWTGDADPWSPFANALVTQAGLTRPYTPSAQARGLAGQAEAWHFELLPPRRNVVRSMARPFTISASVRGATFQVPAGFPRLEVRPYASFISPPGRTPGMGADRFAVMLYGPGGALGERVFQVGHDGLGVWLDLAAGDYFFEVSYRSAPVYYGEQIDGALDADLVHYAP